MIKDQENPPCPHDRNEAHTYRAVIRRCLCAVLRHSPCRFRLGEGIPERLRRLLGILSLLALSSFSVPALALEIQFDFLTGFEEGIPPRDALLQAADIWESHLADPVSVSIQAEFVRDLGVSLAATLTEHDDFVYTDVKAALQHDVSSGDDELAALRLQDSPLVFRTHDPQGSPILNEGDDPINRLVTMTLPLARALGFEAVPPDEVADAKLYVNDHYTSSFDYDRSDGITGYDFVGVMVHEIGHALGWVSGVQSVDNTTMPNGPWAPLDITSSSVFSPMDLFRYSEESRPLLDLSPGRAAYFSLDGGGTPLGHFHTGSYNGDGHTADHWLPALGLMDAPALEDTTAELTSLDLQLLDVIGWDLADPPPPVAGDLNANRILEAGDIDALTRQIRESVYSAPFDLNVDGSLDEKDLTVWVKDLNETWFGDANLNGEFNTSDFVDVFDTGEYEDDVLMNSTWSTGDWNGDAEFDTGDFVVAFRDGGYEQGPAPVANAVPEPTSFLLLVSGLFAMANRGRRRRG